MARKLSFSIAVNLLTENFKKGANTVKNSFRSMQMQVLTFAAALGAGGLGLAGLLSRFRDVARETGRVLTALKNVSSGTRGFADNLRFINDLAKTYGLEVNTLIGNFAKFTASATQANMPMEQQKKVFESLSRATAAFGLSAEQTDGVFLALSQVMGKGKISSEELRKQMGEKLPIAMQAMAKAAGVSMGQLEKLLKQGKLASADIIPKFADALNEMIPDVDIDNLETSINRLSNAFGDIVSSSGFQSRYKALIDWLTRMIQSAGKNIQNIVIGIVAAIVAVVVNGAAKIYKGYAATGKQIVANATATHKKLTAAIAARVEAEKRLEELKLQHQQAVGAKQVALQRRIEAAKQALSAKTAQVTAAHEKAKEAAAQAAAIKSRGFWLTAGAAITGTIRKVGAALKAMWNSFAPAIIVSGLIAIGGYLKGLYDKTKKLEKATADYNKEVEAERISIDILFNRLRNATKGTEEYQKAKNDIIGKYGEYLTGLSDEIQALEDVEGAYKAVSKAALQSAKDRAMEKYSSEVIGDYTETWGDSIKKIRKELTAKFGAVEADNLLSQIKASLENGTPISSELQAKIGSFDKKKMFAGRSESEVKVTIENPVQKAVDEIRHAKLELEKQLEDAKAVWGTPMEKRDEPTTPKKPEGDPDNEALRAAEKRLEALRKLDEEDRKRQIEKQKFDLEMQQKAIDLMDDSFEKRTSQTLLNLEKENIALDEFAADLLKQQAEYAKTLYESIHGDNKGFEKYFADLKKNNFIGENGISILPEGLRPEDIANMVKQRTDAAKEAQKKGLEDINADREKLMNEARLQFSSELDYQLASIRQYYKEQKKQHKADSKEYKELTNLENREIEQATLDHQLRMLQFEADYDERLLKLSNKRYLFEADRQADLLKIKIANQKKLIAKLEELSEKNPNNTELAKSLKVAKLELDEFGKEIKKLPKEKFMEIVGYVRQMSDSLGELNSDLGMVVGTISELAEAFLRGGIIGFMSSLLSNIISQAAKVAAQDAEAKRQIVQLQHEYNKKLREQNVELISSIDYARAFRDNLEALHWLVEKGFISDVDYSVWDALNEKAIVLNKNLKEAQQGYDELSDKANFFLGFTHLFFTDIIEHSDSRHVPKSWKEAKKVLDDWKAGVISRAEALFKLEALGIDAFKGMLGQMNDLEAESKEIAKELAEIMDQLSAYATGTDFDGFLDSAINALKDFKGNIAGLADFTQEALTNAILSSFKYQILAEALKPLYDELANKFIDDFDGLDKTWTDEWGDKLLNELESKGNKLNELFDKLDIDRATSSSSQNSTKGYSVSMDQDTGGAILGRITGITETLLALKGMASAVSLDTTKYLTQTVTISDELKKQTSIIDQMQQLQVKSYNLSKEVKESLDALPGMKTALDDISKNTKKL